MFEYYVYGCKVESNYRCPLLTEYVNQQIFYTVSLKIVIDSRYQNTKSQTRFIHDDVIEIDSRDIRYVIDGKRNMIETYASNFDIVQISLLNIPFSMFLASKGIPVLHSGTVKHKGKIVSFVGEKGAGKSTFVFNSILEENSKLLGDDTIAIFPYGGKLCLCEGCQYIKLDKLYCGMNFYELKGIEAREVYLSKNNKSYIMTNRNLREGYVLTRNCKIGLLKRTNADTPNVIVIDNNITKKVSFLSNVVAFRYFSNTLKRNIEDFYVQYIENCIELYNVILPDNSLEIRHNINLIWSMLDAI